MTISKLPPRPSLESLRKQAKQLARAIAAGDTGAIARAHAQLPQATLPLSQRDAQLVLAREYGFPGWPDLLKEVHHRLGQGLQWAVSEARRRIHDNDTEGLRQLLADHPALLTWRADPSDGGLLAMATGSYSDSYDPAREQQYTRIQCAELLLDAGAVVAPSIAGNLIRDRARGLLELFHRRGLLPQSLKFFAALGDEDGVRACLEAHSDDAPAVSEALHCACHLRHPTIAAIILDRAIALDPQLGKQIDEGPGRPAFIQYVIENSLTFTHADPAGPWEAFVMRQVVRAVNDGDLESFIDVLRREPWMLADAHVKFQTGLVERAVLRHRPEFITALLELDIALLHAAAPPPSQAIEFAFTYVKPHLLPLLLRIWPLPDDLPHAAGCGDLARVKRWFDDAGRPVLGNPDHHFPPAFIRRDLQWEEATEQHVLDTALAWAVLNDHFEVADFLLAHGADINTTWNSHEPASILHELAVSYKNYPAMQFLIDRGIDMTIRDYRWNATAQGWARYAAKDEKMAQWLADAQQRREQQKLQVDS